MSVEIFAEPDVLFRDSVLSNMWKQEEGQSRTEDTERARHEERVLPCSSGVGRIVLDYWE